ncbi:MAG: Rieske 2Fe-2S domain-containing protein [Bacteroidia bacterium]|nr:Rieske 2Fe-2S domain-containing protein [Bacteroidia bacterium]
MAHNRSLTWHKIFESEAVAHQKLPLHQAYPLRIGLKKICLIRTPAAIFALEDACPHKLIALSEGKVNDDSTITCSWHQYCFRLHDGEETTGKNIRPVKTYPLKIEEDGVHIGLPKESYRDPFSF